MELRGKPELAQHLAAAYALGTLRGGARRRFEALARQDASLRVLALHWQERLAAMTELQKAQTPDPSVWKRIENALHSEAQQAAWAAQRQAAGAPRGGWRMLALGGAFASAAALGVSLYLFAQLGARDTQLARLQAELQATPEIRYVSVLHDDQAAPSILVTFDPKHGTLTLRRLGAVNEGPDKSLQLWALPRGAQPRSLGVLGQGQVIHLDARESQLRATPALAVSLEPKGGVSGEAGPTGPVLFKGALLPTS